MRSVMRSVIDGCERYMRWPALEDWYEHSGFCTIGGYKDIVVEDATQPWRAYVQRQVGWAFARHSEGRLSTIDFIRFLDMNRKMRTLPVLAYVVGRARK